MPEYKIIAESDVGGKLCITTPDRQRALKHAALLGARGPEWHVSIEVDGKRYHEPRLERIP